MRVKIPRAWVILASVVVVLCFVSFAAGTAAGPSPYAERKEGYVTGFADGWCARDTNATNPAEWQDCARTVEGLYWEVYA